MQPEGHEGRHPRPLAVEIRDPPTLFGRGPLLIPRGLFREDRLPGLQWGPAFGMEITSQFDQAPGQPGVVVPVGQEFRSVRLEAEGLAGVDSQEGSLWHAYRRAWATARKHLPAADVAAAGGWKNAMTVRKVYQQADQETVLQVVLSRKELRSAEK